MRIAPGTTFSWKRLLGITKARRAVARRTGVPTTRSGRNAKIGRTVRRMFR